MYNIVIQYLYTLQNGHHNKSSYHLSPCKLITDDWIKKLWYIYAMEYYSAIKKNEILPFVTAWIGLEGIMLSEISQREKDKYCMISLMCGI